MDVKKVKRTMKVGPKKDKTLYGLQWVNYGNVGSEALLQEVEAATTLSDSDADLLVKEFARVVIGYVANGHNVDLGVLGTLSPKISAKAVDSEKDCTAQTISSIGVLYRSRQELADDAKAMSITMLSSSSSSATDGGDEGNDEGNDNGGGNNGDGGDLVG
jgi:predicted histone-like DNA-binding protein